MGRHLRSDQYAFAPKVLTCDPAWEGDDELVIALRQGLRFDVLRVMPKNDNDVQVANILARLEDEHQADGVIIDKGYGTGIYSAGRTMGRDWLMADFGSASPSPGYLNLRAFGWGETRDWLKAGGSYPDDDDGRKLHDELIGPETVPRMDGVIQLEAKKDMKKRGQASPNRADALAISFMLPIAHKQHPLLGGIPVRQHNTEYDPLAALSRTLDNQPAEYDPYANL
jgi:hypothetical protein